MTDDDANNSALAYADTLWRSVDTLCGPVDAAERDIPNLDTDIGRIVYACRQWRGEPAPEWWNEDEHGEPFVEESPRLLVELEKRFGEYYRLTGVIRGVLGRVHRAD